MGTVGLNWCMFATYLLYKIESNLASGDWKQCTKHWGEIDLLLEMGENYFSVSSRKKDQSHMSPWKGKRELIENSILELWQVWGVHLRRKYN